MSMQDPIADMIAQIKNAQLASKEAVSMTASKIKLAVAGVLKQEGYIEDFETTSCTKPELKITLRYYNGAPVITAIKRVSRPGLRCYRNKENLPLVANGLGVAIISTSLGVLADRDARKSGVGGEVLCTVF